MIIILSVSIILMVLAGLLISAESAISRISRSRVEDLEQSKASTRLLSVIDDRPRYVNVLLFVSTIASITAFVLVSYHGVNWLVDESDMPVVAAFAIVAAMLILVSYIGLGVAPRTLGRIHSEKIALVSAGPARFLAAVLGPIATLLIHVGNALTPGKGFRQGPFDSQAELRDLVDMASSDSLIEDDERAMIHSVFELSDTFAREVMVPRTEMVFIERDKSLRQALSLGLRSWFSRIPVIGENADDIVGVIYLKDIVKRVFEYRDAEHIEKVEDLMRPPYFVPDSKQADDLLRDMQAARIHMAIVVDEYGGTAGIVTIEDILEEIVGEIADEYDTAAPEVEVLEVGGFRVMSRMNIGDLAELIDIDIDSEEEGVDSVLGLMAKRLGRVPIADSHIQVQGWELVAEAGSGRRNRIGFVRVMPYGPIEESTVNEEDLARDAD